MKLSARDISLAAMFAALAAVAAALFRFGTPVVPFSLVPFVALLAGMLLGPRLGAVSMAVYMLMGLLGLPVFEKPPFGGPAYLLQPTFGFLLGFVLSAYVTGKLLPANGTPGVFRYLLASVAGLAALYLVGLPYLYVILNFYLGKAVPVIKVIQIGFLPFIAFDLLKAGLASFLARAVIRRVKSAVATD
ncbi:MAG: biotin transporter BioY [Desulfocucumaceae bacterium]